MKKTEVKKILIIEARFYEHIADMLYEAAIKELGGYQIERLQVPGAFEIPAAIKFASNSNKYDGFIALGCVIRGKTTHYDYVCNETARCIANLGLDGLAIGFGLITVENEAQALERADFKQKNIGGKAAIACIKMMEIKNIYE